MADDEPTDLVVFSLGESSIKPEWTPEGRVLGDIGNALAAALDKIRQERDDALATLAAARAAMVGVPEGVADETGAGLGDGRGLVVEVMTVPQRLRGVCWTGSNLGAVEGLAGDAWLGVSAAGNPVARTTGGTEPVLEPGWWLLRDESGGVIVAAGDAAARTYRQVSGG